MLALAGGLVAGIFLNAFWNASNDPTSKVDPNPSHFAATLAKDVEVMERIYGINAKGCTVHEDVIKPDAFLSDLLMDCNLSYAVVDQVAQKSEAVFPVTQLHANKSYFVVCDSNQVARYFIYKQNAADYVLFNLTDSMHVSKGSLPVQTRLRHAHGTIKSSLSVAMQDNGSPVELTYKLSDVFAWTIDFFRLQKEDAYELLYEENYVDGKSIGVGNIVAARFKHAGSNQYAFYFENDTLQGYFDEEGNSVKKAFLKAPLKFSRISSRYKKRRFHPILKRYKSHLGTDYAAPRGTPVLAVGDGTVERAGYNGGNGRYVKIRHNSIYSTQYLHLSKFGKGIRAGKAVKQGDVIGYVGSTGLATGPHLCFRFWKNGQQVDPFREKIPPAKPIPPGFMSLYEPLRDSLMLTVTKYASPIGEPEKTASEQIMPQEEFMIAE